MTSRSDTHAEGGIDDQCSRQSGQAAIGSMSTAGLAERPKPPPPLVHQPEPDSAASAPGLVLIGASTGGPQALEAILTALPADLPWPVLVAQHMPATFTSAFAQRLDRICALSVREVRQATVLRPGHVHIAQGDADMIVAQRPAGLIALPVPASQAHRWHPSVDRMVASALNHLPASQQVSVLLTGMGDDGATAMARLRAEGGHTIAQDEDTAVVWGMPGELVRRGGAAQLAPLPDIAQRIVQAISRRLPQTCR